MSGMQIGIVDTAVGPLLAPMDPWIWPTLVETGEWEPDVARAVNRVLDDGDMAINVGAHVGYFTRLMANRVGPTGRVVAFEPAPSNRRLLQLNLHDRPHVDIRAYAISDYVGRSNFVFSSTNPGDHRLTAHHPDAQGSFEALVSRLDSFPWQRRIRVILTDAQGLDLHILRGARFTVDEHRPHVFIEWTPYLLNHDDYPEVDRLIAMGYAATIIEAGLRLENAAAGDVIGDGTGTLHLDPG